MTFACDSNTELMVQVDWLYMLIFNPEWDMHWPKTKQNREWLAKKTCPQNSGFSYDSLECHATVFPIDYQAMFVTASK